MGTSTSFDPRDIARYLEMEMREFGWLCEASGVKLRKGRRGYLRLSREEAGRVIREKRARPHGGKWSPKRLGG